MNIRIDDELQALIPPLTGEEKARLEQSLKNEGCRDAIVVWGDIIVDGHNRYEICTRLGIPFETTAVELADKNAAKIWMIDNQKGRRNLTEGWKFELMQVRKTLLAERGREKQKQTLMQGQNKPVLSESDNTEPKHDTRAEIAKDLGWSTGKVAQADKVRKEAPEVWEGVKDGEMSVDRAYREAKKAKKESQQKQKQEAQNIAQAEIAEAKKRDVTGICEFHVCSCAELFDRIDTPDVIITDPPYSYEYIECYSELAQTAVNVPVVAVMVGQSYLPEVMQRMSQYLTYRWTLAYMTPGGQAVQQWKAKVNTFWKPVLLFGECKNWFGDVAKSDINANEKENHHWGQSESGIADIVKRISYPKDLICDPFAGGGTTAVVSLDLGRRFVGCDINADYIERASRRVKQ